MLRARKENGIAMINSNYKYSRCSDETMFDKPIMDVKSIIPAPKEIKKILDETVVGQEEAKKVLSVAVCDHYKRLYSVFLGSNTRIQKSNILLLGPTGSGKTLLAKALADILNVPFAMADATALTEAGYVGEDVESILTRLLNSADGDASRAEHGIIFIDEIDKLGRKGENPSITRDVSGEGVQQALLKILEGTVANVSPAGGRKKPNQEFVQIDTSNILFICGGAFEGIDKVVVERTRVKNSFGFGSAEMNSSGNSLDNEILSEDLVKMGMMPELLGRLPIVATLSRLTKQDLIRVLTEPSDSIVSQYKQLMAYDGIELTFTDGALEEIADIAFKKNIGARGLRSIMEKLLLDIRFELPSEKGVEKCAITKDTIKTGRPRVLRKVS